MSGHLQTAHIDALRDTLVSIYYEYRDALLNRLYYGYLVDKYTAYVKTFDILIAVGTSGSGIAGLALWKHEYGQIVWGFISGLSIILAVIKPIMDFPAKLKDYSELYTEYSIAYRKLRSIVEDVSSERAYELEHGSLTPTTAAAVKEVRSKLVDLAPLGERAPAKPSLISKLQDEVNAAIPVVNDMHRQMAKTPSKPWPRPEPRPQPPSDAQPKPVPSTPTSS